VLTQAEVSALPVAINDPGCCSSRAAASWLCFAAAQVSDVVALVEDLPVRGLGVFAMTSPMTC